jgi:hypothetical protein
LRSSALMANIRLGWKGLTMTNNLTYYEHSLITGVIFFTLLGHVV